MREYLPLKYQLIVTLGIALFFIYWQQSMNLGEEYRWQGDQYYTEAKLQFAVANYQQALKYETDNPDLYFLLADSLSRLGDLDGALEAYQQAVQYEYARLGVVYLNMGWVQYALGYREDARSSFTQALDIIANNRGVYTVEERAQALAGMGWSRLYEEGCAAATPYFEQALSLIPDETISQRGLSQCE